MVTLAEIYNWFMTGKKPTQAQFWASWGSFWNKSESIPQSAILNLTTVLNAKAEKSQFDAHKIDTAAHAGLFDELQTNKVNVIAGQGLISDAEKSRLSTVFNFDNSGNVTALNAEATTRANADTVLTNAIAQVYTDLRDGVATQGNTLQKLYNLIIGSFTEITVATIIARNAYNVLTLPLNIFVTNDGDGKWALYKATTTGVNATFVKINDQDSLNNALSASSIKTAYESNTDTNAFTNALLAKLNAIIGANTGDETLASIQAKLVSTTNLPEGINLYFTVARFLANLTFANIIGALGFTPLNKANDLSDLTSAKTARVNIGLDKRTTFGNANYSALITDKEIVTSVAFTAPRTVTLIAGLNAGAEIIVADEFQTVTQTNTLTINVPTGKKLNGVVNGTEVIRASGGWRRLMCDGNDNYFFDAGIARLTGAAFTGPISSTSLSGTGNRMVQTDSAGAMAATQQISDLFISNPDVINAINGATFNVGNNFTATITPVNSAIAFQGTWYNLNGFLYFTISDNVISRLAKG